MNQREMERLVSMNEATKKRQRQRRLTSNEWMNNESNVEGDDP